MGIAAGIDRARIEQIVREIVLAQVGGPAGKPNLVVSVSARHVHLTDQDVETLFGAGHKLTVAKDLYQDGFFAAEESVMVVGPRRRMLPTVMSSSPINRLDLQQCLRSVTRSVSRISKACGRNSCLR